MFKNLFKDKKKIEIFSPSRGTIMPIEKTPDDVFSNKILGDGFLIEPKDNKLYSPIDGQVKLIFPTLHGIGIRADSGLEILIHIGIDTSELKEREFKSYIEVGDRLEVGQLLVTFDRSLLRDGASSTITPVIITNMDVVKKIDINFGEYDGKELIGTIELI